MEEGLLGRETRWEDEKKKIELISGGRQWVASSSGSKEELASFYSTCTGCRITRHTSIEVVN